MNSAAPLCAARCLVLGAIAVAGALAAVAPACDTPVYRYAMYRWEPTPYEVYHFYRGEPGEAFEKVRDSLLEAGRNDITPANVAVYPVNLDEDPELKTVPRDVRRQWQIKEEAGAKTPLTLVVNPLGYEVFSGELIEKDVASLVNSPLRRQIGELLKKGHAGVYVLLLGKDDELNNEAEAAAKRIVEDVNAGKLQLYAGPEPYNPLDPKFEVPREKESSAKESGEDSDVEKGDKKANGDAKPEANSPHSVAMLKLARDKLQADDPWLLRNFMAVEDDLHDFADEPMLFVVYGRGRALPPYIGKGIVYDNLVEITDFITSACSCTVKDQNPGVDLLMAYDWESASAAVAERFGSEEGNEESLTDLFPQLIVPGGSSFGEEEAPKDEQAEQDDPDAADDGDADTAEDRDTTAAPPSDENPDDEASPERTDTSSDNEDPAQNAANSAGNDENKNEKAASSNTPEVAAVALAGGAEDDHAAEAKAPRGSSFVVTLGIGMGVAFLALLGLTFFILKPMR